MFTENILKGHLEMIFITYKIKNLVKLAKHVHISHILYWCAISKILNFDNFEVRSCEKYQRLNFVLILILAT